MEFEIQEALFMLGETHYERRQLQSALRNEREKSEVLTNELAKAHEQVASLREQLARAGGAVDDGA